MRKDKRDPKLLWRNQGGTERAYGDFREYGDVGGGREALKTSDPEVAWKRFRRRREELEELRENEALYGVQIGRKLGSYIKHHLKETALEGNVGISHLEQLEHRLGVFMGWIGHRKRLEDIKPADLGRYVRFLKKDRTGLRGRKTPTDSTLKKYLAAISGMYSRAISENVVPVGYNPVSGMHNPPTDRKTRESDFLELEEAGKLLSAALSYENGRENSYDVPNLMVGPIIGAFLLTGGDFKEVMGLRWEDVNFDRKLVYFRPNEARESLKTEFRHRPVPLWPQLEKILLDWREVAPESELIFPSPRTGGVITDIRKILDKLQSEADRPEKVRTKAFRHTYCAARLQTLEAGAPVPIFVVSRELGHGSTTMVERIYGHLGRITTRNEVVEYPTGEGQA